MKKLCAIILSFVIVVCVFCGCTPAENTETDATAAQTSTNNEKQQTEKLTYQINEVLHFPISDENIGFDVMVVRSSDELKLLYTGDIPENANVYDNAYFKNHTLIVINYVCGHIQLAMLPGEFTSDEEGIYHIAINGYSPEVVSDALSYHQLVLETSYAMEQNTVVEIDYTDHILTSDEFYSKFSNP